MKELKDLVAGDEVLVTGMSHRHIAKVDKVTKTQIIVNNARFRRDSGWQCGSDRWNVRRISVPTEKEISDIKGRKHAVVLFSENRSEVRNGIPSTTMGFVAIDLDANTYKD